MKKQRSLDGTPNLSDLLKEATRLGCTVATVRGTGEVRVTHAKFQKPITLNNRRKDGNRALIVQLRGLQQDQ